jgi:drug/metabolite transporter (DMT)-like permease
VLYAIVRLSGKNMRIEPEDRKYFIFIGVIGYFFSTGTQIVGTKYAGASVASLINSMNPVFITFFAVIILGEKLTMRKIIAIPTTLIGVYIILGGAKVVGEAWGAVLSIVSVLLWSISSAFVRRVTRKYDPLVITTWAIFLASLFALPSAGVELALTPHGGLFSLTNILCFLYLGLVCTALAGFLWNKSLSLIEASTCSLFYPIQPLVSVVLGVIFLEEKIDLRFGVGAFLIVGGILVVILSDPGRTP